MGVRTIKFKTWIPYEYKDGKALDNTGMWSKEFTEIGVFHQWAAQYEEFESGAGNYTVALVELPNGEMVEVLPTKIKFL